MRHGGLHHSQHDSQLRCFESSTDLKHATLRNWKQGKAGSNHHIKQANIHKLHYIPLLVPGPASTCVAVRPHPRCREGELLVMTGEGNCKQALEEGGDEAVGQNREKQGRAHVHPWFEIESKNNSRSGDVTYFRRESSLSCCHRVLEEK